MKLNIKKHRENANLSQGELGELCGWDQARQSHYETGRREPGLDDLDKIAKALNTTMYNLIEQSQPLLINESTPSYNTPTLITNKSIPEPARRLCDFITDWMTSHTEADCHWLEGDFKRHYKEYEDWLRQKDSNKQKSKDGD